jgi:hypothetical protein
MFKAMLIATALGVSMMSAHAQTAPAATPTAGSQPTKMKSCNAEAGGRKGEERRSFMKDCLKANKEARAGQRDKMKTCNADAKGKQGDERRAFMKACLSK